MRPLDPRLLRHARAARRYVVLTAALGGLTAALVVAQALLLARALAPVVAGRAALPDVAPTISGLAAVVLARVAVTAVQERFAHRAATRAVAELRAGVVEHAVTLGAHGPAHGRPAAVATLATRGLDALEPYFVRYLPQLLLAATVTPAALVVVLGLDWVAAATIAATLPLVPVFMVLVGRMTQGAAERRLVVMERLGHQVLDLLVGLPTLRALGRERGPGPRVRALGEAHRRATLGTLRVAFLSGMVLELLTTLSVALVAVGIGFRLVDGGLDLETGLAVLMLAPEVYLPLRQVGAHFHASVDGVAAADRAFAVLETRPAGEAAGPGPSPAGRVPAPDLRRTTLRLAGVGVRRDDRAATAPCGLDVDVAPGSVVALAGPNGSGKSTAVAVALGLLPPDEGEVLLVPAQGPAVALPDVEPASYWRQVAWVPQRPVLEPGTLREAVLRDAPADDAALARAARLTGLDAVLASLPDGWATALGQGGAGLSLGQRQRVALARALVGDAQLVVLDEPTAHLDDDAAAVVLAAVAALRDAGRTVLLVAHRPDLLACADHVVAVRAAVGVDA
ncbi:thiol reductant ABC exporter subunit CydD [Actinotalea solisilvae]|uniref:thiol reductant ABC exporter subunit CydD n=1 Tax=Actinotalea solisilvae TaxID=2072922 RepID=UPI0018F1B71A|nr:thiol reductant ABC exporter subunit CydD [Actinotalea solisilvae]